MQGTVELFYDNMEEIELFFGKKANPFKRNLATQLAIRGLSFQPDIYEQVQEAIKIRTKWYQSTRSNLSIRISYYVHLASVRNIDEAVEERFGKVTLLKELGIYRSTNSYLAALYIKDAAHAKKMEITSRLFKKSRIFSSNPPPLQICAMLATIEEIPENLVATTEQYFKKLRTNFKKGYQLRNVALMMTMSKGIYDANLCKRMHHLSELLRYEGLEIEERHYATFCLLTLTELKKNHFNEFFNFHEEIYTFLQANPKKENTFFIAAQLFIATHLLPYLQDNQLLEQMGNLQDMLDLIGNLHNGGDRSYGDGHGGFWSSDGGGDSGGSDGGGGGGD